jgi:hypothetical protein
VVSLARRSRTAFLTAFKPVGRIERRNKLTRNTHRCRLAIDLFVGLPACCLGGSVVTTVEAAGSSLGEGRRD